MAIRLPGEMTFSERIDYWVRKMPGASDSDISRWMCLKGRDGPRRVRKAMERRVQNGTAERRLILDPYHSNFQKYGYYTRILPLL